MPRPEISGAELRLLRTRLLRPVGALLAAVTLVSATGITIPLWVQLIPLALSLVLLGLPHGAVDHLVPRRIAEVSKARSILVVVAAYLVLGSVVVAGWVTAPALMIVLFLVLTLLHWGAGDLYVLVRWYDARHLGRRGLRIGALLVRGALPMLVPLVAHPDAYRAVVEQTAVVGGASATESLALLIGPQAQGIAAIVLAVGIAGYLLLTGLSVVTLRAAAGTNPAGRAGGHERAAWRTDAAEITLLVVFFLIVPPVLAVGLYFCLWHSLRHAVRLALLDDTTRRPLDAVRLRSALLRFCVDAAPLTLVALGMLATLFATLPGDEAAGALGTYLVLLSILTLPHAAVVVWMDHRQRLWAR